MKAGLYRCSLLRICALVWLLSSVDHVSAAPADDLREDWLFTELFAHEGSRYGKFAAGQDVPVVLAVEEGALEAVEAEVIAAGGRVTLRESAIGYLQVVVPLRAWPTVRTLQGVTAAALDGRIGFPGWSADHPELRPLGHPFPPIDDAATASLAANQVTSDRRPRPQGSLLQEALGLTRWWRTQPNFDGRGVGIAIVEPNSEAIAFDHPAFHSALDSSGRSRPKIADVLIVRPSWQRVRTLETFTAGVGLAQTRDGWVRPPRSGTFHFGRADLPSGLSLFVLWDPYAREVRIDANKDFDFSNDPPLRDIRTPDPGFVSVESGQRLRVRISDDGRELLLLFSGASHSTQSASVAAASAMPVAGIETQMAGTAPAAQLVLIGFGTDAGPNIAVSELVEALLAATRHPQADVISISMASIYGWPSAGRDVVAVLAQRMVSAYGKPIVFAAGNGADFGRAAVFGEAALHVGAFMPAAIARRNLGARDINDSIAFFTSGGPRMDGGLAPDVIGPIQDIAAAACHAERPRTANRRRFFNLPPCYELYGGTSAAAPAVAGFVAALISGLRQHGRSPPSPELLYAAVRASARPLPGVSVALQGAGVPQADVAWRLLSRPAMALEVGTHAAVDHVLVDYLPTGTEGVGLYEREGWIAGQTGRRSMTIRRDSGPAAMTHRVRLQGDTETFSAPGTLVTRRGVETRIPVTVTAHRSGVHSVRLLLEDLSGRTANIERRLTIVAADNLPVPESTKPEWGLSYNGALAPLGYRDIAVRIPGGTEALQLELDAAEEIALWLQEPSGWIYHRRNLSGLPEFTRTQSSARVLWIPQPAAGTWTFRLFRGGTEEFAIVNTERPYRLRIAAVNLSPSLSASADGAHHTLQVAVEGPTDVGVQPLLARTMQSNHRTDAQGLPVLIPFRVEENTALAQWHLTMQGTTSEDRVHAYLYDCTSGYCLMRDASVPASPTYLTSVNHPAPGEWLLAVTPGPRSTGSRPFTVEFSQAPTQAVEGAETRAPIRITPGAPYTRELPDICPTSAQDASLLLRVMPVRAAGADAQVGEPRAGDIVPAQPALRLC